MNSYNKEYKGNITLGEKVMVSDPCYGLNTWCQGVLENVLPGKYECHVGFSDEGDWGTRVADIEIVHKNYTCVLFDYDLENFTVGVDSGQAGIFDYGYYEKYHTDSNEREHVNSRWYDRCYDMTHCYSINPNYVSFLDLPEYKAILLSFRTELNELKEKYPELDVETTYESIINHYHELEHPEKITLDGLTETLRKVNAILSGEYEKEERTEGEEALISIDNKFSRMLGKVYSQYLKSANSQKKLFCLTGSTMDGLGFVSSSGYGDGSYECWTAKNEDGKIIAIRVEFINEDEEDEED